MLGIYDQYVYTARFIRYELRGKRIVPHALSLKFKSWRDYVGYWKKIKEHVFKEYSVLNYYELMHKFPDTFEHDVVESTWSRKPRDNLDDIRQTKGWNFLEQFCAHYHPKFARYNNIIEWHKTTKNIINNVLESASNRYTFAGRRRLQKINRTPTHSFPSRD
jgi:hypothetical protein